MGVSKTLILTGVFAASILALFCHGYIWRQALEHDDASCGDIQWGGTGNASAHTISVVTFFIEIFVVVGLGAYYTYIRVSKAYTRDSAKQLSTFLAIAKWGNALFIVGFCLVLFLSGFLVSAMGNHAATSLLSIHGCTTDFTYDYMWLPWTGVSAILFVAYLGHLLIPESTKNPNEFAWNYSNYDNTKGSGRAFGVRRINYVALYITIALCVASVVCLWVGFGVFHALISRSEDGPDYMCNCASAVNQTLCHDARVAMYDTLDGLNSARYWLCGAAGVVTLFLAITFAVSRLLGRRSWITIPFWRNFCILLSAVALPVNGYAVGSVAGSPTLQLHDLCCPQDGDCYHSITSYPMLWLAVISFVLWAGM